MDYQIQSSDQIIDNWVPLFRALSLKQFEDFSVRLDFPILVSAELREIAKAFSLSVLTYSQRITPDASFIPMFVQSDVDPLIQIWNNTFSQLKSIGYADSIFSWGQGVHRLSSDPYLSAPSEWDIFLTDWALDPNDPKWISLELPARTIAKLQSTLIQYEFHYQDMRFGIKKAEEKPSDPWETYAFGTLYIGTWLHKVGDVVIRLKKWSAILRELSPEESDVFDRWGHDTFALHHVKNYFSVTEFAQRLSL
jgi:hypothetical protein